MMISLCADKGAPGVTTAALGLTMAWGRPVLLAEADPAGSDLPYRMKSASGETLALGTGLVSLGLSLRDRESSGDVRAHQQFINGGSAVLIGPAGPEQTEAIGASWSAVAETLWRNTDTDVIVDCGRLISDNAPTAHMLQRSDLTILVARSTAEGVAHLRHGLNVAARIINRGPTDHPAGGALQRLAVLMVNDPLLDTGKRSVAKEVYDVLQATPGLSQVPLLGVLPADAKGAAALRSIHSATLHKLPLMKALQHVIADLHSRADQLESFAQTGPSWSGDTGRFGMSDTMQRRRSPGA